MDTRHLTARRTKGVTPVLEAHVTDLDVRAFTVPTDHPEADGTLAWDHTTMVVVVLTAETRDTKTIGLGYTYAPVACANLVEELLAPVVVSTSPLDVSRTFAAMRSQARNAGYPGIAACAVSAVDTALWDLRAGLLGLPLHRLLGAVRDRVPAYGSGGFTTYTDEELQTQLNGWLEAGARWVKIKIGESAGQDTDRDLARVALAKDIVAGRAELFVDANGGYSVAQAVRIGRALERLDVRWFEEPVSSDDLVGLAEVRGRLDVEVAAGEYGYDATYFRRMCEARAVGCLQLDVTRCGGITGWFRGAAVAASHGLDVSVHCAPAISLAAAAATPRLRHQEWFHDHVRVESMLLEGTRMMVQGDIELPCTRGNGLTLRNGDSDRFRVL